MEKEGRAHGVRVSGRRGALRHLRRGAGGMGARVQKCDRKDEMPEGPGAAGVWKLTQGQDARKSWRRAEEGGRRGHGPRSGVRALQGFLNESWTEAERRPAFAPARSHVAWAQGSGSLEGPRRPRAFLAGRRA